MIEKSNIKDVSTRGKNLVEAPDLKTLADSVCIKEQLDLDPANIGFVLVYPHISKRVAGRCILASKELKLFSGHDYIIEMSGELWDDLDEKIKYILMYHELLHVLPVYSEKKGEYAYKIADHDVKDFSSIIKKYGIEWFGELQELQASVYDLKPEERELVTA